MVVLRSNGEWHSQSANTFDQKPFHSPVDGDLKEMVDALANGSRVTVSQILQLTT